MASHLALAQIEGQRRIRVATVAGVQRIWDELSGYDEANLDEWLSKVLPHVQGSQRTSVALMRAYVARATEGPLAPVDVEAVLGSVRNGAPPKEVYTRPFVTLWGGLGGGKPFAEAASAAAARATSTAAMDAQLAMRSASEAIDASDENIYGYTRVADGDACTFCQEVDGAYVKGSEGFVMALHNNCGCGLEPNEEPHRGGTKLPDGTEVRAFAYGPLNGTVAVQPHGELGAVLTGAGEHFTDESQALG